MDPLRDVPQFATALQVSCVCELHWSSKPDALGARLSGAGLKAEVPNVGYEPFVPQGEAPDCVLEVGFMVRLSQSFLFTSMWFISHLPNVKGLLCQFLGGFFFRGNCSVSSCRFYVSMGGAEFRIFLHHLLDPEPLPLSLSFLNLFFCKSVPDLHH